VDLHPGDLQVAAADVCDAAGRRYVSQGGLQATRHRNGGPSEQPEAGAVVVEIDRIGPEMHDIGLASGAAEPLSNPGGRRGCDLGTSHGVASSRAHVGHCGGSDDPHLDPSPVG